MDITQRIGFSRQTNRDSQGFRFEWAQMMNTAFGLEFTYRDIDVDVERSGESLGLSAANRALLNRNGDQYTLAASYQWIPSPAHIIESQISFVQVLYSGVIAIRAERNNGACVPLQIILNEC